MGMVDTEGWTCIGQEGGARAWWEPGGREAVPFSPSDELQVAPFPDLGHPGTRAFLLEDVRRAWGYAYSDPVGSGWGCRFGRSPNRSRFADTEAEALILALEADNG